MIFVQEKAKNKKMMRDMEKNIENVNTEISSFERHVSGQQMVILWDLTYAAYNYVDPLVETNMNLVISLPEIWDKMATDMRTLTKYGDQILL